MAEFPERKLEYTVSEPLSDKLIEQQEEKTQYSKDKVQADIEAAENKAGAFDAVTTGAKLGFYHDSLGGSIRNYQEFLSLKKRSEEEFGDMDDDPLLSPAEAKKYFNIDTEIDISANQASAMSVFKREEELLELDFQKGTRNSTAAKIFGWGARLAGQLANPVDLISMALGGVAVKVAGPIAGAATRKLLVGQAKGLTKAVELARKTPLRPLVSGHTAHKLAQANIKIGLGVMDDAAKITSFTKTSVVAGAVNVSELQWINKYRKELNVPLFEGLGVYTTAFLAPAVLVGLGKTIKAASRPMSRSVKDWKASPHVKDDIPVLTELSTHGVDDIVDDIKLLTKNYDDIDVGLSKSELDHILPWVSDPKEFIRVLNKTGLFTPDQLKNPKVAAKTIAEMSPTNRSSVKRSLFDVTDETLSSPVKKQDGQAPKAVNQEETRRMLGGGSDTDVAPDVKIQEKFKQAARANEGLEDSVQQQAKKLEEKTKKKPKTEGEAAKVEEPEKIRPLRDMSAEEQTAAIAHVNKEITQALTDFIKCRGG